MPVAIRQKTTIFCVLVWRTHCYIEEIKQKDLLKIKVTLISTKVILAINKIAQTYIIYNKIENHDGGIERLQLQHRKQRKGSK